MKKLMKITSIALAFITLFALSFTGVDAKTTPKSVKVKRAEVLSDTITNNEYGFTYFTTTEGDSLYCIDNQKLALKSNTEVTLVGDADAGVQYILEHGYPNVKPTGNVENDKIITQAAIWWYLDDTNQGSNKVSNTFRNATKTDIYSLIPNYIKPLVANAKKAQAKSEQAPKITLTKPSSTLKLTSDKKYYESALMVGSLTNASTYKVTTSTGEVTDKNGNTKTTFSSKEQFKIVVPVSEVKEDSEVNINVTASNTVKKAKIFKSSNNNYQRVVGLYDDPKTAKINTKLAINVDKHICEIIDNTFYGNKGTVVDEKTYTKECKKTCEIIDDVYYGKAGNVVDKDTYKQECEKSCILINDVYYGKNGNVVDKDTYKQECEKSCVIVDNVYYGKDGNVVDANTYNAECGVVVAVPNTSANIPMIAIAVGSLLIIAGSGLIIDRTRKSYL